MQNIRVNDTESDSNAIRKGTLYFTPSNTTTRNNMNAGYFKPDETVISDITICHFQQVSLPSSYSKVRRESVRLYLSGEPRLSPGPVVCLHILDPDALTAKKGKRARSELLQRVFEEQRNGKSWSNRIHDA
jgi:hypothetical protein